MRREGEPNRYSVRCEIHKLRFNPSLSNGCVLCKREAAATRLSVGPIRVVLLLGAMTVLILFWSGKWALRLNSAESAHPEEQHIGNRDHPASPPELRFQIDPEGYREWLVDIESKLYQEAPPSQQDVSQVVLAAQKLAEAVERDESRIVAAQAMMHILAWAMALDGESATGYGYPDFSRSRKNWEQLRDRMFRPAQWFMRSHPRLEMAQSRREPEADPELLKHLRRVAQEIHHLIVVGVPESRALGEVVSDDARNPEVRKTRLKWREWSRKWTSRVKNVGSRMPPHPGFDVPTELIMAYQELGSSLHNLSVLVVPANDYGVPFLYQRQSRFDAARHDLKEAEDYLSQSRIAK